MLKLLCNQISVDIASIVVNAFFSAVIIAVSIITLVMNLKVQKTNCKIQEDIASSNKESAVLPFKIEIINSLMSFTKQFYDNCTKLFLNNSVNLGNVANSLSKLEDMFSQLYVTKLKLSTVSSVDSDFYNVFNRLYDATDKLYRDMAACIVANVIVSDLQKGYQVRTSTPQLKNCKELEKDIFNNPVNFSIYTLNMDSKSVEFIKQYTKVYNILDELKYKEFLNCIK